MCDSIEKSSIQSDSSVKKKKRGRKPKNKTIASEEEKKVPKKRGRKPKNLLSTTSLEKVPKKRGRKPAGKIISLENSEKKDTITIDDCIITHLPIKMSDLIPNKDEEEINDTITDVIEDEAITLDDENDTSIIEEDDELSLTNDDVFIKNVKNSNVNDMDKDTLIKYYNKKIKELENKYQTQNNMIGKKVYETDLKFNYLDDSVNKWKENTDVCCWWCCHNFDSPPVSIPEKIYDKKYYVFGCFCSFNCAYSYNINLNDYKIWERLSMLKSLYSKMYNEKKDIVPAPPRKALSMFGGHLSIDEFRNNNIQYKKEYLYLIPPMVSIIPLIEENNQNTENNDKGIVPINTMRSLKLSDKLKRNKPINNSKYSLVKTMGLKKKSNVKKKEQSEFFI